MSRIPVITMQTLRNCKDTKQLIEIIPARVICDSIISFDALKSRYKKIGLRFVSDESTYEVKS